jgi:hypothetical protein
MEWLRPTARVGGHSGCGSTFAVGCSQLPSKTSSSHLDCEEAPKQQLARKEDTCAAVVEDIDLGGDMNGVSTAWQ